VMGNIIFILLTPLTYLQFFVAFFAASLVWGLVAGLSIYLVAIWFVDLPVEHVGWVLVFALLGSALLGTFGIIAGIWASRFDQMAAFQNFVIMPLTFLSGVFYSIHSLPDIWQSVSKFNPFFYMIDGFRYGFLGRSDGSISIGLIYLLILSILMWYVAFFLYKKGYKIKS